MVAASGGLSRFDPSKELMKFPSLISSEYASGARRQQGALTKAGTTYTRRVLVEGAWAYRSPAKVSQHLPLQLATPPQIIQDVK